MADRDPAPPEAPRPSPEDEPAPEPTAPTAPQQPAPWGPGSAGGGAQRAEPPQRTGSPPGGRPGGARPPGDVDGAGVPTYDDGDSRVFLEGDG
jgi:hypothetical protein